MAEAECESWRREAEGYKQRVEELEKALAGRVTDLRYAVLAKEREDQWNARMKLLAERRERIHQEWDFIKSRGDKDAEVWTGGLPEGVVETVVYDATRDKVDFSFPTGHVQMDDLTCGEALEVAGKFISPCNIELTTHRSPQARGEEDHG